MAGNAYVETAQAYADGVRRLFGADDSPTGERGGGGPSSYAELSRQAEALLPVSEALTAAAADKLAAAADPGEQLQSSTQLLAKAASDLQVSIYLLEAAKDEELDAPLRQTREGQRSSGAGGDNELLDILLGKHPPVSAAERGRGRPESVPAARHDLAEAVEDSLTLITKRAGDTGKVAAAGLIGLGLSGLGPVVAGLGSNIAQLVGGGEALSHVYRLARDFALQSYETFVALVGRQLASVLGEQVMKWLEEIKEAEFFGDLVQRLYQVEQTRADLVTVAENSGADLSAFHSAIGRVEALSGEYERQTAVAAKALKWARYLGGAAAVSLPGGPLLMAAVYLLLCGYVVLTGADYVDAPRFQRLGRVRGVRQVVEAHLATA